MAPPKKIYGLIGYPVKHSFSPLMHNLWFRRLKERGVIDYDAEYKLFEVKPEELEDFLLNRKDVVGFNITIPHKVRTKEILEKHFSSDQSREVLYYVQISGAINTVKREGNKIFYLNTDVYGFRKALTEDLKFEPKDKNILVIGCGGAGRAVIAALIWRGSHPNKIYIYESSDKALESAKKHFKFSITREKLKFITKEEMPNVIKKCSLLVNATPVGMNEWDGSPIDKNLLHGDLFVYDIVYNRETQLVKDANEKKCKKVVGGLNMLLHQGARAFELWTNKNIRSDEIEEAKSTLEKALGQK